MRKITFTRNLSILRKNKGMTQETLAECCGVSRQAVTKWEAGSSVPDLYKLADIAEALDVSIDQLLLGDDVKAADDRMESFFQMLEDRASRMLERMPMFDETEDMEDSFTYDLLWDDNRLPSDEDEMSMMADELADPDDFLFKILIYEQMLLRGNLKAGFAAIKAVDDLLASEFEKEGPSEDFFRDADYYMEALIAYTKKMRDMYMEIAMNPELGEDSEYGCYPKYEELIKERHRKQVESEDELPFQ